MNSDERIRNQLGTVMSAAVRLGMTSSGMSREALAAEVRDLVELAIQVTNPAFGELSAEGEKHLAWQKEEGKRQELFWRNVNAHETATSVPTSVADTIAMDGGVPGLTWPDATVMESAADRFMESVKAQGIREVQPEPVPPNAMPDPRCDVRVPAYGAGMEHDHICNKAPGHADGAGGSDHLCDACGQLFTTDASTPDDDVEIEL